MSYKTIKDIGITEELYDRKEIPNDYHCECNYCRDNFIGEIYHTPSDSYYTQHTRKTYYYPDPVPGVKLDKHICPGHWQGYRYAIQKLTKPGDTVFDPTVGTGSAIVEAINLGRKGVGIELEFDQITNRTIQVQHDRGTATAESVLIPGDARDLDDLLPSRGIEKNSLDLIVNGTPYPVLGGGQSDAPERGFTSKTKGETNIYYEKDKNVGVLKGQKYWDTINHIYSKAIEYLKPGGKFVTIIKDPTQKKKPYLLHKMITDEVLKNNPMKYYGTFIHRHLPTTLFQNTYSKRFPDVLIPYFQTGTVLEKK